MSTTLERIRDEAKTLPLNEREALLAMMDYDLYGSAPVSGEVAATEAEAAWDVEIGERVRDITEGRIELISGDDADRQMEAFMRSRRQPEPAAL